MTLAQAQNILISAAEVGQSKGAYSLKDSAIIFNAVETLKAAAINSKEAKPTEETTTPAVETPVEAAPETPATPEEAAQ